MSSRVFAVLSNNDRTAAKINLVYEYNKDNDEAQSSPSDYEYIIGTVIDHDGGGVIHSTESPAVYEPAYFLAGGREISNLEGRLLTLVDATMTDPEQRKAFKQLVSQNLWRWSADNEQAVRECFRAAKEAN